MARSDRDQEGKDLYDEAVSEEEKTRRWKRPPPDVGRNAWTGNGGRGATKDGETHCCQACAEDIDCTCTAQGA